MAKKSKSIKKQALASSKSWLLVDPSRVRFQHSRIRPYFSGCGRSVRGTLESIRNKEISVSDIPPIQVIVGPEDEDGPWYFSLNNRRLWVLKRCREEGLLEDNLIRVRVREPKSGSEEERYTLENCAVEAKFIREKDPKQKQSSRKDSASNVEGGREASVSDDVDTNNVAVEISETSSRDEDNIVDREEEHDGGDSMAESDDSSDDEGVTTANRFAALLV